MTAEIQGTCSVHCVGTRIAPPPSRLEPQTQDTRGVGSLACIAPDLVMNPKPGPSEKESVSDTRPLDRFVFFCMHGSVCLSVGAAHTYPRKERVTHTHACQPTGQGRQANKVLPICLSAGRPSCFPDGMRVCASYPSSESSSFLGGRKILNFILVAKSVWFGKCQQALSCPGQQ